MSSLSFGSLFAGIGGIDLGLERSGIHCKWQVEKNEFAQRVLEKHWPSVTRWDDVKTWPQRHTESVDVICGGFPCQDLSLAGRGKGLSGERSGLWGEMLRIVCVLRPRYVLIENVAALLVRGLDRVLWDLAQSGYDAEWSTVSACSVGAPHTRDRLFIVAYGDKERRRGAGYNSLEPQVGSRLNAWKASPRGRWGDVECWARSLMENGDGIVPATERSGVVDGIPDRLDRVGSCGNAVVPQVAEAIGRGIVRHSEVHND